jgi:amino acid adenylation domain-containing protein
MEVMRMPTVYPQHFERQALLTPDGVAVSWGSHRLSYGQLNRRADQLAGRLVGLGVEPDVIVPLLVSRGPDLLVAILAVLKAGGAFLPLAAEHPPKRSRKILSQSRARLLLTSAADSSAAAEVLSTMSGPARPRQLSLEITDPVVAQESYPTPRARPNSLAYTIYTSGSTGAPKGAMIEHAGMLNHIRAKISSLELTAGDCIAQTASPCFDISVWQFLAVLLRGGRVHVIDEKALLDPALLIEVILRQGITVLEIVPSQLHTILDHVLTAGRSPLGRSRLRWLISTGDVLTPELCRRWLELHPETALLNAYGPTECSDDVTHHTVRHASRTGHVLVPIGRALPNLTLRLLDDSLEESPPRTEGELHIGGVGVGRGYQNDPRRTAAVFIPDPFGQAGGRLYKTGDGCRRRRDGTFEFLGRFDDQIKVRGFRIEPGEVERSLELHGAVRQAVVTARKSETGQEVLIAFLVLHPHRPAPSTRDLRAHLASRLPTYLVPATFVICNNLPLTSNGKLDRRRLETLDQLTTTARPCTPPLRSRLEEILAAVWREVLPASDFGPDEDFFEIGGDSLQAARLCKKLQELLGEYFYVSSLLRAPTVSGLAEYLREQYPRAVARILGSPGEPAPRGTAESLGDAIGGVEIRRFRGLVEGTAEGAPLSAVESDGKNPPAVFILASPRSGSTLLRVMLAGHPSLFVPPELALLPFTSLQERRGCFSGHHRFWLEGTMRALMEIRGWEPAQARRFMEDWEARDLSVRLFYRHLQEAVHPRLLVDKTSTYALRLRSLYRAEALFDRARYIYLCRDPREAVPSFVHGRMEQVLFRDTEGLSSRQLAELTWLTCNQNILDFLARIPESRRLKVTFEDLVRDPRHIGSQVADFLQVGFDDAVLQPYDGAPGRMTDGLFPKTRPLGDVKFFEHRAIDPRAADGWRRRGSAPELARPTRELAARLGYATRGPRRRRAEVSRAGTATETVVPLRTGVAGPALFLVHSWGGQVAPYALLARHLGAGRPCYGLSALGLREGEDPLTRLEEVAALYLERIRTLQPEGPYLLGGYCYGSFVAFEMARQLEAQDERVELLAILDTYGRYPRLVPGEPVLGGWRPVLRERLEQALGRWLGTAAVGRLLRCGSRLCDRVGGAVPGALRRLRVRQALSEAVRAYRPRVYGGRLTFFQAADRPGDWDPQAAWGGLVTGGIEVQAVPGGHVDMLRRPHVQVLAQRLSRCLERATGRPSTQRSPAVRPAAAGTTADRDRRLRPHSTQAAH